jgi:hypothetical protein
LPNFTYQMAVIFCILVGLERLPTDCRAHRCFTQQQLSFDDPGMVEGHNYL